MCEEAIFPDYTSAVIAGIREISRAYKGAVLLGVNGFPDCESTNDPLSIKNLTAYFDVDGPGVKSLIIQSEGLEAWGPPIEYPDPTYLYNSFNWPIKLTLADAYIIKVEAGYEDSIKWFTLNHPSHLNPEEPVFTFFGEKNNVIIGAMTGKVALLPTEQDLQ